MLEIRVVLPVFYCCCRCCLIDRTMSLKADTSLEEKCGVERLKIKLALVTRFESLWHPSNVASRAISGHKSEWSFEHGQLLPCNYNLGCCYIRSWGSRFTTRLYESIKTGNQVIRSMCALNSYFLHVLVLIL